MESLPKVNLKSITFHYCTVICDVGLLRPIDVIFTRDS